MTGRVAEGLPLPAGVAGTMVNMLTARQTTERARRHKALRYVGVVTVLVTAATALIAMFAGRLLGFAFRATYSGDADIPCLLCIAASPSSLSVRLEPLVAMLDRRALMRRVPVAISTNRDAN